MSKVTIIERYKLIWQYKLSARRVLLYATIKGLLLKKFQFEEKLRPNLVLDLGGNRNSNKDIFNILGNYSRITVNTNPDTQPDILANIQKLPIQENSYDLVTCFEVLEYVENPQIVINEIARVLKPSGFVILSWPKYTPSHSDYLRPSAKIGELIESWSGGRLKCSEEIISNGNIFSVWMCFLYESKNKIARIFAKISLSLYFDSNFNNALDVTTGYVIVLKKYN